MRDRSARAEGAGVWTRRAFLRDLARLGGAAAGGALLLACTPTPAPVGPARVHRVGVLVIPGGDAVVAPLWARLEELGYVEGRNLVKVDLRGDENPRYDDLAAELVRLPVDVIAAGAAAAIQAAMAATSSIPIMMVGSTTDPVAQGFVASIARPGGNVTGVLGAQPEVEQKRLQILLEAVPSISKVAVLQGVGQEQVGPLQAAARSLGLAIVFEGVENRDGREGVDAAFEHAVSEGADALLVRPILVFAANRDRVISLAERHHLPAMYPSVVPVRAGGLMTYDARLSDVGRRAADYVDRILRGARPADLPVELPTRYYLTLNMRTARALGLTLPFPFLLQVDEIIDE